MIKILLAIVIASICSTPLAAQHYQLSGKIDQLSDSKIFLTRVLDGGIYERIDSTYSKNGTFSFSGKAQSNDHNLYIIQVDKKFSPLGFLFLEPGQIRIEGLSYHNNYAKGTYFNDAFADYSKAIQAIQEEQSRLHYMAYTDKAATAEIVTLNKQRIENLEIAIQSLHNDFVYKHRHDWMGTYLLKKSAAMSSLKDLEYRLSLLDSTLIKTDPTIQQIAKQVVSMKRVQVGNKIGDFVLPTLAGKDLTLSSLRGKYVLLDFWASWCVPCRAENPNVIAAYTRYKSSGFEVVAVSLDKNLKSWKDAVQKDGLPYINVVDQTGKYAEQYSIRTIPQSYLIDPDGFIIAKDLRGEELQEVLEKYLHHK